MESCCRHLDDIKCCQNGVSRCSAGENISEHWTVLTTLPFYIQVMDLLVTQALTRPQTCYEPSNDHLMAVSHIHP
jgi:hypothetical protein